jgi:mannitol/fructose-specific phosphotransferase system IIA component (Ntr-type)
MKRILEDEYIRTDVEANSWREAVQMAGDILVQLKECDQEFIYQMVKTVENLGPYMILLPDVALFHAPPGEYVHKACLSFVTFKNPVYFTDFDNQRIKCAFALGAVDPESHMEMLQQVAMLLQDKTFLQIATNNGTKKDLLMSINNCLSNN